MPGTDKKYEMLPETQTKVKRAEAIAQVVESLPSK
jgi:hypothetical protein